MGIVSFDCCAGANLILDSAWSARSSSDGLILDCQPRGWRTPLTQRRSPSFSDQARDLPTLPRRGARGGVAAEDEWEAWEKRVRGEW